jgi:hypothetical protein
VLIEEALAGHSASSETRHMVRRTIKIKVTRRVRVVTRVRYSVQMVTMIRRVVAQERWNGEIASEAARMRMLSAARAALPSASDEELLGAIQQACDEDEEEMG